MAFYDKFPYTNFQELNLDWLTQEVSKVRDNRDATDANAATALASEKAAKASETAAASSQQAAANSETAAAGSAAASAEYLEQIGTHTAGAVAEWLKENLQPTSPPLDESLTVSGAAADAAAVGVLKADLRVTVGKENLLNDVTWTTGGISENGAINSTSGFRYSSLIPVTNSDYTFTYIPNGQNRNTRIHGYDSNGTWVKQIMYQGSGSLTTEQNFMFHVQNVSYIRISTGDATYTTPVSLLLGSGSNYREIKELGTSVSNEIYSIVKHTANLFDQRKVVDGHFIGGDYSDGVNSAYSYIKLKLDAGDYVFADLSLSANTDTIIVLNGNGLTAHTLQLKTANKFVTFNVPADTYEVAISYRNASVNKASAMVVRGTQKPPAYIKYGYVPNMLYSPNVNEVTVKEVTVKKDGTGDFTSFVDAIRSITDSSEYNRYIVYVHAGTYDIVSEFFNGAITEDAGIVIPNYVDVIGVGLVDNIILDGTLPDDTTQAISMAFSTINLKYNNTLKNITVKGKNVRYAVHDESGNQFKNYTRIVENCVFETVQNASGLWQNNSAYGHGLSDGCKVKFKNCKFETVSPVGGVGAYICHDGGGQVKPCYVDFENCTFKKSPYANLGTFRVGTYSGLCKSFVNINGCDFSNGELLVKEEIANSGTGILLTPVGYGNRNFTTGITDSTGEYTKVEVY